MTRKALRRKIQARNNSLNAHQAQFSLTGAQSKLALKKHSPYLIIGIGLLAGVVTRVIGWHAVYSLVSTGASFYPYIISKGSSPDESNNNG